MKRSPRVFFSFRSPFSWMAVERMQRAIPDVHKLLQFIPYWEPDQRTREALQKREAEIRYAAMSKAKHLYILQDTKRLAGELGLRIVWPVDIAPWWEVSHLGWLKARRLGQGTAFYKVVTEARWQRGENISDPNVVRKLAESVGLDGDIILQAIDDPDIRAEGVDSLVDAYQDDIFGVPYFRIGGHRLWGFDRVDRFIALLNCTLPQSIGESSTSSVGNAGASLLETSVPTNNRPRSPVSASLDGIPSEVESQTGSYDNDTAGGCG
jgi:2-hydroxychromene-2-carboxylate isomerase